MGQTALRIKKATYPAFNLLSGLFIRLFNPFKKGDFIEINGHLGSVEHKGLKSTTLKNIEGEEIQISNTLFYTKHLHNLTLENIVNIEFRLDVSFSEDMAQVKKHIVGFLEDNINILSSPSPRIFVSKIKNTHVELGVKAWCSIEKYLEVDAETEVHLKEHLRGKGVSLEIKDSEVDQLMMA
ncbi:mechanosensitive ion channel family protein [Roseivirga sp.]|uniref:mechanosensitive ion channel family protein n=1 Tax=Roseivirga sp. TaxID=1964215 RepID=UPI003B51969B